MKSPRCHILLLLSLAYSLVGDLNAAEDQRPEDQRPNVILVITDDQGYGDLGAHGNTMIQTPNLDRLHQQSTRFTDFHVDPTCSPTRAALMTGRYSSRTGVWHTILGRSIVHRDEVMLPELFQAAGYKTAMFGKWHLGDNYPYFPEDRGFAHVFRHGGGGVGQTPDYWGNDYFDDTYWLNGKPVATEGYCTDVWFDGALEFIEQNRREPFFIYLSTNAPHGPYLVDKKYSNPYQQQGVDANMAKFYGMITNIDENMGRLMEKLDEWKLADNTILIFMSDNGTAAGAGGRGQWKGFNAGMRGAKGSEYDGGHRVPFFVRWPGHAKPGRDVDVLSAHIDVLPTLAETCGLKTPPSLALDGQSLVPLLQPEADWPARTLLVHSQRIEQPVKWRKTAVMTQRWRLVNEKELYDIEADPAQKQNIAADHPEIVKQLTDAYEAWWESTSTRFDDQVRIPLGEEGAPVQHLTAHDWHADATPPWHQNQVSGNPRINGYWAVEVQRPGRYRFELRLRPAHVEFPLQAGAATVSIGDHEASSPITADDTAGVVEMDLSPGKYRLQATLDEAGRGERGAYFVDVHYVGNTE